MRYIFRWRMGQGLPLNRKMGETDFVCFTKLL